MEAHTPSRLRNSFLSVREIVIFALLGAVMFVSKLLTEALPNIHLLGMFIVAYTAVFKRKALFPIYVFVFLTGLFYGFATWWIPYLYIWAVLWVMASLIPEKLPDRTKAVLYILVCSLHGFLYGALYAPAQALLYGFDFEKTLAWIAAGFYFDMIHGISNALCGFLIMPMVTTLKRAMKQ